MNPAEVVESEVKRRGRFQAVPLLAEGVRQACEPLAPLAQRSVLALDLRRANPVAFWVSADVLRFGAEDLCRAVAALAFGSFPIVFDVLRIVDAVAQVLVDGARIRGRAVRRQLVRHVRMRGCRQLCHEAIGTGFGALTQFKRQDQFSVEFDSDEAPSVAHI